MVTIGSVVNFLQAERSFYRLTEEAMEVAITGPSEIRNARPGEVTFCSARSKKGQELLAGTRASLVIIDQIIPIDKGLLAQAGVQAVILSENARLDFIRVLEHFFVPARPSGIDPSAVVAASAAIGKDVFIGAFCCIQGEVEIGEGTVIHSGVHVYERVRIGRDVTIFSGAIIGKDGWGYERNELGKLEKFPHLGSVELGDHVELGAHVVIDRATLGGTMIGNGCKINNGTHIGHNVEVGEDTIILPHCYLGGSSKVGKRCWIGPKTLVRNGVEVGSDVFVGMGSVVTKNIPNGISVMGSPAREVEDQKKLVKHWADVIAESDQG
ncbi:MAG: UDP-3-O-(3-hydroxymyristoyl)glucosamine N-acyltransferase [Deltaproteobacteria bacterium]|nr:UDP-3-O-(3-hydroxymyristoyl)glucosamine N-acyltransferase [Deltaproteobacteria bacterium]